MRKTACLLLALCAIASAHFQVVYAPATSTAEKSFSVLLFFTHPFSVQPIMKTGLGQDGNAAGLKNVYIIHDGKEKNMLWAVKNVTVATPKDSGPGQKLFIDQSAGYKSAGDYEIVVVPNPYWEVSEQAYIQQITKLIVNRAGFATDWNKRRVKGCAEIIPLVKPYEMIAGALFRALVVDNNGRPAPNVSIEIECLNADVDINNARLGNIGKIKNERLGAATIQTDPSGVFAFIPQKAGYWGFAAISAGTDKVYKGKPLEQDAVVWIQVVDAQ